MDTRILEDEVNTALQCIEKGENFILEGGAGSGKTYSLISLIETLDKLNIDLYKEKTVELQKMLKKVYKNEISKEKALEIFSVNLSSMINNSK